MSQNLDAAIERLKAAGAHMIGEPFEIKRETVNIAYFDEKTDRAIHDVRKPTKKAWRIALFSDPDGVTVELVER
jgi:predicted enzyme related to lactoylglutathione lyase